MISTVAIAAALAAGFSQIGGKLLEKGLVEPALKPMILAPFAKIWGRSEYGRLVSEAGRVRV